MIVADTNIVAYLLIGGQFTDLAQQALLRARNGSRPHCGGTSFLTWSRLPCARSTWMRAGRSVLADAPLYMRAIDHERPLEAMRLSVETRIATYDCEFVVLARRLLLRFVTKDKALLKAFGDVAVSLEDFASGK